MAVGLAFVDIVGDTTRTEPQIERDMSRVLATVQDALSPVEVQAAVDSGTEQELTRELNSDIRAAQQAINAIRVNTALSPDARRRLTTDLRQTITAARASIGEIQLRVAERPIVEDTVAAVQTAVQVAQATAPAIELETNVDSDRVSRLLPALQGIGSAASAALPAVGKLAGGFAAFGSAVPALAAVTSAIAAMAPAAALAAPAIVSVGLAMGTVKLATAGVGDAVAAAFDPSDPEAYAEALKGLAPNARAFVGALHEMQPALKALQQDVQNRVFAGFDQTLKSLARTTLPVVRQALQETAGTLNLMGQSAAKGVQNLAEDGALGDALKFANAGLSAFADVPGRVVQGLGQIAAAAAPIFSDIAVQLAGSVTSLTDKLSSAFAEGTLKSAIEGAVSLIGDLGHVLGNVGKIISAVFSAADASGTGLIGTLSTLTDALAQAVADPAVQAGLKGLFETMGLLSKTVVPLLAQAFVVVAQTVQALLPGVQVLIKALGDALQPVIQALGPLLVAAGTAISQLVVALAPLLVVAGQLIAQLGPILTPIIVALTQVITLLAPVIQQLASILSQVLGPILAVLPTLLQPFLDGLVRLIGDELPVLQDLLTQLTPSLLELSSTFVTLAQELAPVIAQVISLSLKIFEKLLPLMAPLISFVAQLAAVFAGELARQLQSIVIPAIQAVANILRGDFSGALTNLRDLAKGIIDAIVRMFVDLPNQILQAFGGLTQALYNIGQNILQSLINGVVSKIGSLKRELSQITDLIPDWKGPADRDRKLLTENGQLVMQGFIAGVRSQRGALRSELGSITDMIGTSGPIINSRSLVQTAGNSAPPPMGEAVPNVQVFVGNQQITDIVDVRIGRNNRAQSRAFMAGARN